MISAATLRAMKAAGCTVDQIIAVVEANELEAADQTMARREADRLRKRRQREKENATKTMVASEMSRGHRVTAVTSRDIPSPPPSPSPDKEKSPLHPPKENNLFPDPPPQPRSVGARGFEKFWAMFPNKVGKAAASKAFDKTIGKVDLETMLAALDRYVHKTDDRPWCNPATWLNQERWADQPASPQARASPPRRMSGLAAMTEEFRMELENDRGRESQEGDVFDAIRRLPAPS